MRAHSVKLYLSEVGELPSALMVLICKTILLRRFEFNIQPKKERKEKKMGRWYEEPGSKVAVVGEEQPYYKLAG